MPEQPLQPDARSGADDARGAGDPIQLPNRAEPRRRRRPAFGRVGHAARAWAQHTFSREQVVAGLKTLLWVAPLTLLIWVYAEREQIATLPNPVTIPVTVTSNDPTRIVTLTRPTDPFVMATITGPRAQLDALRERLESRNSAPVHIEVEKGREPGTHRIPASRVGQDKRFADAGVTVTGLQPELIEVVVDNLVEVDADVRSTGKLSTMFLKEPTFEPAAVKVRGPESVLNAAKAEGRLFVPADLTGRPEIAAAAERRAETVTVPDVEVAPPLKDARVTVAGPKMVSATVYLKAGREYTIPTMSVFVVSPPGLLKDHVVSYDDQLRDVTVIGPEEEIEKLGREAYKAKAMFEISIDDAGLGQRTAQLKYDLPTGVSPKPGQPTTISFELNRRSN